MDQMENIMKKTNEFIKCEIEVNANNELENELDSFILQIKNQDFQKNSARVISKGIRGIP